MSPDNPKLNYSERRTAAPPPNAFTGLAWLSEVIGGNAPVVRLRKQSLLGSEPETDSLALRLVVVAGTSATSVHYLCITFERDAPKQEGVR